MVPMQEFASSVDIWIGLPAPGVLTASRQDHMLFARDTTGLPDWRLRCGDAGLRGVRRVRSVGIRRVSGR